MAALACAGITPAYAGKSTNSELSSPCTRDHPRVCGEKHTKGQTRPRVAGSPPRMRGKAFMFWPSAVFMGITPAYAGKSRAGVCIVGDFGDHPRVCGEKRVRLSTRISSTGSPPRMRGKVAALHCNRSVDGITPAYAGKRLKRSHRIGHFSCILCLFHSVLHRASASGGSRAGPCAPPCLPAQNAVPV